MTWNPFSVKEWIAWIGATFIAALTMMSYAYGNFVTYREFSLLIDRLERIEQKIDQIGK